VGASQFEKDRTHEAIMAAASTLVRGRGMDATTVGDVMGAAGRTHGGFYAHFSSREALLVAAVGRAFEDGQATLEALVSTMEDGGPLDAFVSIYLSPAHVENPATGCAAAALANDSARASPAVAEAFATGIARYLAALEEHVEPDRAREGAHRADDLALLLSAVVGAVVLSRAMASSALGAKLPRQVESALRNRVLAVLEPMSRGDQPASADGRLDGDEG
jgi:TetR/AcrR family transcriptional repressor of nem operon